MNKKALLIIGLIVLGLVLVGAIVFAVKSHNRGSQSNSSGRSTQSNSGGLSGSEPTGANYQKLAHCSAAPIFTTLPTTLADFDQIIPLGQVGVPDHTLPTDHMYFAFKHVGNTVTNPDLFAPGNIVVTSIMNSGEKRNGVQTTNDYALTFYGCKGVSFLFGHVETLAGQLQEAVASKTWDQPCQTNTPAAGEETFYCTKTTDIVLNAGDLMGKVGGAPQLGAFDLGAHKEGYVDPGYVRSERYPNTDAVCSLDYFTTDVQTQLYTLVKRTAPPRCGSIGQDVAGTLQGNWFSTTDLQQGMSDWNSNFSMVHHNIDPTIGVVGIGGKVSDPMMMFYHPTHSGTINREPSEVSASTTVYCYQHDSSISLGNGSNPTGKTLIQMVSATTLSVEHKSGDCTANETFTSPTTYYR